MEVKYSAHLALSVKSFRLESTMRVVKRRKRLIFGIVDFMPTRALAALAATKGPDPESRIPRSWAEASFSFRHSGLDTGPENFFSRPLDTAAGMGIIPLAIILAVSARWRDSNYADEPQILRPDFPETGEESVSCAACR